MHVAWLAVLVCALACCRTHPVDVDGGADLAIAPCGDMVCGPAQLCVRRCTDTIFCLPDGGDCPQGYTRVGHCGASGTHAGCTMEFPPQCVDVPSSCVTVPTCGNCPVDQCACNKVVGGSVYCGCS
jgi:hypothetical protein